LYETYVSYVQELEVPNRKHTLEVGKPKTLDVTEARQSFATLISEVGFGHDRVVLCRNGKKVAALVPLDDLALLERLENEADLAEVRRIDANSKFFSSAEARKILGLK
jgi:prevent-host-death family protein